MDVVSLVNDKIDVTVGIIVALLSYFLGEHWFFFAFFAFLNIADYITRWIAARITGTESSKAGWVGVLKKLGYWIMIMLGFGMSAVFIEIGEVIGIDLGVTTLVGWFVLATLISNEARSILENLYDAGYTKIPKVLIKGLAVANKALEEAVNMDDKEVEEFLEEDTD